MKKSKILLISGIVYILVAFIADSIISNYVLDFSDPSAFGVEHIITIVGVSCLLIVGIVMIIISRKKAKLQQ